MEWPMVVALIVILPVTLLPAVFVRYLGIESMTVETGEAGRKTLSVSRHNPK